MFSWVKQGNIAFKRPGNEKFRANHSPPSAATSLLPPAAVAAASAPRLILLPSSCLLHHVRRWAGVPSIAVQSHRIGDHRGGVARRANLGPRNGHLAVGVINSYIDV